MNFDFDMNLYKVFYLVAKNKSFSKAADELFVTQPSVSYSIKRLEDRLNIKLFKRNYKGIKITPEGEKVLEYVEKSYNNISLGERSLKENRSLDSGKISIGVQAHIGKFLLFPYIENFHNKYPNIEINISSRNTKELIKLLENGDVDFVIDTSPIETEYNNLIIEPLMKLEHCFVSSRGYTLKSKNVKIGDLNQCSLILPVNNSTARKELTKLLKYEGVELKPVITIETTEMLIDAVKRNMGVGYIMKNAIEQELKCKELEEIHIDIKLPKLLLNLVYIESNLTNVPKVFIKELKNNSKKHKII